MFTAACLSELDLVAFLRLRRVRFKSQPCLNDSIRAARKECSRQSADGERMGFRFHWRCSNPVYTDFKIWLDLQQQIIFSEMSLKTQHQ